MKRIEGQGVEIAAARKHYISDGKITPYDNVLIFGYGNTKIEDMETGVKLLSLAIK
jgi:GntR family transcriptional regulator/MocR family aminotransferase